MGILQKRVNVNFRIVGWIVILIGIVVSIWNAYLFQQPWYGESSLAWLFYGIGGIIVIIIGIVILRKARNNPK